jgi:glycosyltransferase involved in cell wall biosynthesis
VHVWAPRCKGTQPDDEGVSVHRLAGHFGPSALAELDGELSRLPGRVLVQYVPHAFGWKAMNVPFCLWLWGRRQALDVMFHEVAFPLSSDQPWKHNLLAVVNRGMASLLVRAAQRIFVSIPGWKPLLHRLASRFPEPRWLPIPSNLPTSYSSLEIELLRQRIKPDATERLVGHFGTYGPSITALLEPALLDLLRHDPRLSVVLLGRGGPKFAAGLISKNSNLRDRLIVPGELSAETAGTYLASCDVLLQPYPDGISSRRGSAMAGLSLGCPIVATRGHLTEPIWQKSAAVAIVPQEQMAQTVFALLDDPSRRAELGRRAAALYESRFAIKHTINALRQKVTPCAGQVPA